MSEKRHFTVVEGKKEHGLFVGRSPSSVAKKVVSKLSKGGKKVIFELREITQGSKKKTYGPYEGIKKKLSDPVKIGDRVYKYESKVHRVKRKGGENDPVTRCEELLLRFDKEKDYPEKVTNGTFTATYSFEPNYNMEQIEISIPENKGNKIVLSTAEKKPFIRFLNKGKLAQSINFQNGKNKINSISKNIKDKLYNFIIDDLPKIRNYSKFSDQVTLLAKALE